MNSPSRNPYGKIEIGAFKESLRIEGRYLNDHCLFPHGETFHLFGITGPIGKGCYDAGSESSFLHATSENLENWSVHQDVLSVDGTGPDSEHVFAPHVIEKDGEFFMLYTGVDAKRRQRICLARSKDLFAWSRSPYSPVIVPSLFWSKWPRHGQPEDGVGNCRDPHVARLSDGRFAAYWAGELNDRFGKGLSCVCASVSDDLIHWQEIGPIFAIKLWQSPPTAAAESPCVVEKDGKFWLFFKHGWCTHYVQGDGPFDFEGRQALPLGFAHAAEIFNWRGEWLISHCSGEPDDFEYRTSNRRKGLFIAKLEWPDGGSPAFRRDDTSKKNGALT